MRQPESGVQRGESVHRFRVQRSVPVQRPMPGELGWCRRRSHAVGAGGRLAYGRAGAATARSTSGTTHALAPSRPQRPHLPSPGSRRARLNRRRNSSLRA